MSKSGQNVCKFHIYRVVRVTRSLAASTGSTLATWSGSRLAVRFPREGRATQWWQWKTGCLCKGAKWPERRRRKSTKSGEGDEQKLCNRFKIRGRKMSIRIGTDSMVSPYVPNSHCHLRHGLLLFQSREIPVLRE